VKRPVGTRSDSPYTFLHTDPNALEGDDHQALVGLKDLRHLAFAARKLDLAGGKDESPLLEEGMPIHRLPPVLHGAPNSPKRDSSVHQRPNHPTSNEVLERVSTRPARRIHHGRSDQLGPGLVIQLVFGYTDDSSCLILVEDLNRRDHGFSATSWRSNPVRKLITEVLSVRIEPQLTERHQRRIALILRPRLESAKKHGNCFRSEFLGSGAPAIGTRRGCDRNRVSVEPSNDSARQLRVNLLFGDQGFTPTAWLPLQLYWDEPTGPQASDQDCPSAAGGGSPPGLAGGPARCMPVASAGTRAS
jgi:hypothetical protein